MDSNNKSKLFWIGLFVSTGIAIFVFSILYLTDTSINTEYKFTYISHCKECTILQNNKTYKFYTDEY